MNRYQQSKKVFANYNVDTEKAIEILKDMPISVHCWQGDDVMGFDNQSSLDGGIQTTGNYVGRARTPDELMQDMKFAFSLMTGKKRLNLHSSYAILGKDKGKIDRDCYTVEHFIPWINFYKENNLDGIDFNPTFFSHKNVKDNLTLSSPDATIRKFWIRHGQACIKIAEEFANKTNSYSLLNIWIPDGMKDTPSDRLTPRLRLRDSLDEILSIQYDKNKVKVAVESKVFGIGLESYTVGNGEFYQNYAATRGISCLLDNGHYHPTENVSDKISSLLAFYDSVALHITRSVRWDSDHVVTYDDELKEICTEIVRCDAVKKVMIGLDYFDASINRIAAFVIGERNVQKALLYALLQPNDILKNLQENANFTKLLYLQEELKTLPYKDIWEEYLNRYNFEKDDWFKKALEYENKFLRERK